MRKGGSKRLSLVAFAAVFVVLALGASAAAAKPRVLLVCKDGAPTSCRYHTIQSAVNAAHDGDWVLVWPSVYHEKGTSEAGVYITTPGIHLRGMDRNGVIVDGTDPGASEPCTSNPALQDFNGGAGRNGIEVYKTSGTYVENLTVCNYLTSAHGEQGNEIWWNGGDGSGQIGMHTWWGNYLSATSTFWGGQDAPHGEYAIFISNADGPGSLTESYGSNMADSVFYVGACPDCNATLDQVHAENSALGYSGTNAGGHLVVQNSEWDENRSGIVPNSLNNDDKPPPQSGLCPGSTTQSCTFFQGNYVHDNNNPDVPGAGIAGAAPVGSGIEVSGGSFDTVRNNRVEDQGAWGIVIHDFPDTDQTANCNGGQEVGGVCYFNARGNLVHGNALQHNGFFGNPTNGDLANEPASSDPRNCFYDNTDPGGLTSDPPNIQDPSVDGPPCDRPGTGDSGLLASEIVCASGLVSTCDVPGASYPQQTQVKMLPLPQQPTMPNPCAGVPDDPWCKGGQPVFTGP